MKKIILCTALAVAIGTPIFAQEKTAEDPVVMTIAGKDIPLSEFLFIAQTLQFVIRFLIQFIT